MGRKKQINARLPDNIYGQIADRARLMEETRGAYLGLIVQWWFAQGTPPVRHDEARRLPRRYSGLSDPLSASLASGL